MNIKAKISDIFISIQGEGKFVGEMALFIRFSKCNLRCSFCDTIGKINTGEEYTVKSLLEKIKTVMPKDIRYIVFTGGEPFIYADFINEFLLGKTFKKLKAELLLDKIFIIETNGTIPFNKIKALEIVSKFVHRPILSISPKRGAIYFINSAKGYFSYAKVLVYRHFTKEEVLRDIRMTRLFFGESIDIYLQPIDNDKNTVKKLVENNLFGLKLSVQIHKFLGLV